MSVAKITFEVEYKSNIKLVNYKFWCNQNFSKWHSIAEPDIQKQLQKITKHENRKYSTKLETIAFFL